MTQTPAPNSPAPNSPDPNSPDPNSPAVPGRVVLVSTPIGNLGDISLRALALLRTADLIYAEDTRHSAGLLNAHEIPAAGRLRSLHAHNEAEKSPEVVATAQRGYTVAYISDAGTPGMSDPGERLVRACVEAGVTVEAIPGASAVLAAIVVSGLPTTPFVFLGFLARKGADRLAQLQGLAVSPMTTVIYESPRRLAATLADLEQHCGGQRAAAVLRELTKLHEQAVRATLSELSAAVASKALPERGECVIVVGPADKSTGSAVDDLQLREEIDRLLNGGMRVRDIADTVSARHGIARRDVYDLVVARKNPRT